VCHSADHLVYHAAYKKYYYSELIVIVRLLCTRCGTTHALIPSFSLPGTSIGTAEAESYLHARSEGASRMQAGRCFFRTRDERTVPGLFREDDFPMHRQHEGGSSSRRESVSSRIRLPFEPERIVRRAERIEPDYSCERNLSPSRSECRALHPRFHPGIRQAETGNDFST
jgi:hypothetical protein